MKNQAFFLMADSNRQRKLDTILRSWTNDSLTHEQIQFISQSVIPGLQYTISVFTEPTEFCDALVLEASNAGRDRGKIVFGQALFGKNTANTRLPGRLFQRQSPAAAIIARHTATLAESVVHSILIYVPSHLLKGAATNDQQEFQKKSCV